MKNSAVYLVYIIAAFSGK